MGEGPTDYSFLRALVARHLETLLLEESTAQVEIGPVLEVLPERRHGNQPGAVITAVNQGVVVPDLLFVHADASGHADRIRRTIVAPIAEALAGEGRPIGVVGVLPNRETEAWMLADVDAIARCLGVTHRLEGPWKPKHVHTIEDPKQVLGQLVQDVRSGSARSRPVRRTTQQVGLLFAGLADEIDFSVLRKVPAFNSYEMDLRTALRGINLIS